VMPMYAILMRNVTIAGKTMSNPGSKKTPKIHM
jgi:hypothetical protein